MARITKPPLERRKEIIEAAKTIFMEKGFEAAQISDIVQQINVSQGLVYHYFRSKTEMLYAVIDDIALTKQSHITEVVANNNLSARQKIDWLLDYKLNSGGLDVLDLGISSDVAVQEYCSKKITSSAIPMVLELLQRGNSDGSWHCEYPEETALFIANGFRGFYDNFGSINDKERAKKALSDIIHKLLGGIK